MALGCVLYESTQGYHHTAEYFKSDKVLVFICQATMHYFTMLNYQLSDNLKTAGFPFLHSEQALALTPVSSGQLAEAVPLLVLCLP